MVTKTVPTNTTPEEDELRMESADDILARQVAIAKAQKEIKQLASKQPIAKPATI